MLAPRSDWSSSAEVTNCLYPVCGAIKERLGGLRDPAQDNRLFILLENDCRLSEAETIQYCNFLLEVREDGGAGAGLAVQLYNKLGCTLEAACSYCYRDIPGGGPPPPPPPPGAPAPPCDNKLPSSCPTPPVGGGGGGGGSGGVGDARENIEGGGGTSVQGGGMSPAGRRRRAAPPPPPPPPPTEEPLEKVDFDTEANFIKSLLSVPAEFRPQVLDH